MFYINSRLLSGRHPPPSPIHEELANRHAALRWWKGVPRYFPGEKITPPPKVERLERENDDFLMGFPSLESDYRADLKRWNTWKNSEVYCVV